MRCGGGGSVLLPGYVEAIGKQGNAEQDNKRVDHRIPRMVEIAMMPKTVATSSPAGLRSKRAMPTAMAAMLPKMPAISLRVALSRSFMAYRYPLSGPLSMPGPSAWQGDEVRGHRRGRRLTPLPGKSYASSQYAVDSLTGADVYFQW